MTPPTIRLVHLGGRQDNPLLVLGPSVGTSAEGLWSQATPYLQASFHVIGWELPGHGRATETFDRPISMAELAQGVIDAVDGLSKERGAAGESFHYAGCSIGGAVGLQLAIDASERLHSFTMVCSAPFFGGPEAWTQRADTVRAQGTPAVLTSSAERWFAPGFMAANPDVSGSLLRALQYADRFAYARICEALGSFDLREQLSHITMPLLAIAGGHDIATPVADSQYVVDQVPGARLSVLSQAAHLAPAEAPVQVAALIADQARLPQRAGAESAAQVYETGMTVRRQVLGDAHVDRAIAQTSQLTADFQHLITQYAWGSIWTRPGLDRRSRSMITLTALIALGHDEELAMHVRAALGNGLSREEIKEVLLQSAIYCGVPAANTAFRVAQEIFDDINGSVAEA